MGYWCWRRRLSVVTLSVLTMTTVGDPQAAEAPADMALIPAGPFLMGNNNDFYDNDNDEKPQHVVDLPSFFIDIYPVTNQDYKAFVDATGHQHPQHWSEADEIPEGYEKHPVVGVNYFDATAYAAWKGRRLPSEQEWEKASRGTKGIRWPWGNVFDESKANVGQRKTSPVGAYPKGRNAYGLYDMAGNVWEWTSTWYAPYPDAPPNRAILRFLNDTYLSVRGGSASSDMGSARGADRGIRKPNETSRELGFRTAMDAPGYAGYQTALHTIELAREINKTARLDITDYEEHARSRELIAAAMDELLQAEQVFTQKQFVDSGLLAQRSIRTASQAQRLALDVKRDYQAKQEAATAAVLNRLQARLNKLPAMANPDQQALVQEAENRLKLGRQFEAEGGWGYAQMNAYIGLATLGRLKR
jgi:formylglycine-generating enzyme required for sulfatase activity